MGPMSHDLLGAAFEGNTLFRDLADLAPMVVWVTGASGSCIYLNRRWQELTGQTAAEGGGYGWLDCVHPDDQAEKLQAFLAANAERRPFRLDFRLRRAAEGWSWVLSAAVPRWSDAGAFLGYIGSVVDIDEPKRAEEALQESGARLRRAQDAAGIGDWELDLVTDEVIWSDRLFRLLRLDPARGQPSRAVVFELIHAEDRERVAAEIKATIAGSRALDMEFRVVLPDGAVRWLASRGEIVSDEMGRPSRLAGVNFDVTARKAAEERIIELALNDPLTGLPNRRMLHELLVRMRASARRSGSSFGLLFIDLDEFKQTNDTLGHTAGDVLLVEAGRRLRACVREGDAVGRLGGDEFAVLAPIAAGQAHDLGILASRLVAGLDEPFAMHGVEVRTGASIGIAVWPDDADDIDMLLSEADLALYAAKQAGRGTWRFFQSEMQERARKLAALDRDLRRALERGEFVLHYQPIVHVDSFELQAIEALVRWNHPERGLLLPSEFLRVAERSRLVVALTFWVLAEAMRQAAAWRAAGLGEVGVTVNLAAAALEADGLAEHVAARLRAEALPATALLVEVTEGAVADDGRAVVVLEALRRMGIRVGIDDFGAGYSSLARLRDLPLDLIKIDGAFLAATPDSRGEAILRAVAGLAQSLGLPTVVEGVETVEQFRLLRRVGVTCAQGYLLARPMPASQSRPGWRHGTSGGRTIRVSTCCAG